MNAWRLAANKLPGLEDVNPRYRVFSNLLMILKGMTAPEDREEVVKLSPDGQKQKSKDKSRSAS